MQPEELKQPSVVQALPSSQFVGGPGWQAPFTHASPVVQGLLSLHGPLTGACTQVPAAGSQESWVHTLDSCDPATKSSQNFGLPG